MALFQWDSLPPIKRSFYFNASISDKYFYFKDDNDQPIIINDIKPVDRHIYIIPKSETLNDLSFEELTNVQKVKMHDSATSINDNMFVNLPFLYYVNLNHVETIGNNAFDSCNNLVSIYGGDKLTTIGDNAFANCNELLYLNLRNTKITSANKTDFERWGITINSSRISKVSLPKTVTEFTDDVFADAPYLYEIDISECPVTELPSNFATGCQTHLKKISLNKSVVKFGDRCFYNANYIDPDYIANVILPQVTYLGTYSLATAGTKAGYEFKNFTIPSNIEYLGSRCLYRHHTPSVLTDNILQIYYKCLQSAASTTIDLIVPWSYERPTAVYLEDNTINTSFVSTVAGSAAYCYAMIKADSSNQNNDNSCIPIDYIGTNKTWISGHGIENILTSSLDEYYQPAASSVQYSSIAIKLNESTSVAMVQIFCPYGSEAYLQNAIRIHLGGEDSKGNTGSALSRVQNSVITTTYREGAETGCVIFYCEPRVTDFVVIEIYNSTSTVAQNVKISGIKVYEGTSDFSPTVIEVQKSHDEVSCSFKHSFFYYEGLYGITPPYDEFDYRNGNGYYINWGDGDVSYGLNYRDLGNDARIAHTYTADTSSTDHPMFIITNIVSKIYTHSPLIDTTPVFEENNSDRVTMHVCGILFGNGFHSYGTANDDSLNTKDSEHWCDIVFCPPTLEYLYFPKSTISPNNYWSAGSMTLLKGAIGLKRLEYAYGVFNDDIASYGGYSSSMSKLEKLVLPASCTSWGSGSFVDIGHANDTPCELNFDTSLASNSNVRPNIQPSTFLRSNINVKDINVIRYVKYFGAKSFANTPIGKDIEGLYFNNTNDFFIDPTTFDGCYNVKKYSLGYNSTSEYFSDPENTAIYKVTRDSDKNVDSRTIVAFPFASGATDIDVSHAETNVNIGSPNAFGSPYPEQDSVSTLTFHANTESEFTRVYKSYPPLKPNCAERAATTMKSIKYLSSEFKYVPTFLHDITYAGGYIWRFKSDTESNSIIDSSYSDKLSSIRALGINCNVYNAEPYTSNPMTLSTHYTDDSSFPYNVRTDNPSIKVELECAKRIVAIGLTNGMTYDVPVEVYYSVTSDIDDEYLLIGETTVPANTITSEHIFDLLTDGVDVTAKYIKIVYKLDGLTDTKSVITYMPNIYGEYAPYNVNMLMPYMNGIHAAYDIRDWNDTTVTNVTEDGLWYEWLSGTTGSFNFNNTNIELDETEHSIQIMNEVNIKIPTCEMETIDRDFTVYLMCKFNTSSHGIPGTASTLSSTSIMPIFGFMYPSTSSDNYSKRSFGCYVTTNNNKITSCLLQNNQSSPSTLTNTYAYNPSEWNVICIRHKCRYETGSDLYRDIFTSTGNANGVVDYTGIENTGSVNTKTSLSKLMIGAFNDYQYVSGGMHIRHLSIFHTAHSRHEIINNIKYLMTKVDWDSLTNN